MKKASANKNARENARTAGSVDLYQRLLTLGTKHWRWIAAISVAAAVGVFATICFLNIGTWSIWFDESFGAFIIRFNFLDIAKYTSADVHPPLYYWVLKGWAMIFGNSDVALRSLSVVFGGGTIIFGFLLAKTMFGRKAALIALPLLALSPMLLRYGIEARMYTMAAMIVVAGTYVMVLASQRRNRKLWVLYGILVAMGMWTHYFTAFAWVAHWVWRLIVKYRDGGRGKKLLRKFFSRNWIIAYVVAIGLYLPWLPFMIWQLRTVTGGGFWIPPIGADTLTNYATSVLFYGEHDKIYPWVAALMIVIVTIAAILGAHVYRSISKKQQNNLLLLMIASFVPVVLLFVASLPPMPSSFIDRYLLPSIAVTSVFFAVIIAARTTGWVSKLRPILFVLLMGAFAIGIANFVHFGNYNTFTKNTSGAKAVIESINAKSADGDIIIADTPWVFYDAMVYDTTKNPVYFLDASTDYYYGSLKMLKDNDFRKIKDINSTARPGDHVWYVSSTGGATSPPQSNWKFVCKITVIDPINSDNITEAVKYLVE